MPPTSARGGTLRETIAPLAMVAPSPTSMAPASTAPVPTQTPSPITGVPRPCSACPTPMVTPCVTEKSSPIRVGPMKIIPAWPT